MWTEILKFLGASDSDQAKRALEMADDILKWLYEGYKILIYIVDGNKKE